MEDNVLNITETGILSKSPWLTAVHLMRTICIPTIVLFGLLGNTIICVIFTSKEMRKKPCSVLLVSIAVVDNAFLLSLLASWLDGEVYSLLQSEVACKSLLFVIYVTSFLSVWYIVAITCERFVATHFALKSRNILSKFREKMFVLAILCVACVLYLYIFWTTTVVNVGERMVCTHSHENLNILTVASWVDTALTVIVPFCLIASMNVSIIFAITTKKQKINSRRENISTKSTTELVHSNTENGQKGVFVRVCNNRRDSSRNRATKILLLLSGTFIVLNLPSHAIRLYNLLTAAADGKHRVGVELFFFQELANVLHYISFSCNVLLYTISGQNFRQATCALFRCSASSKARNKRVIGMPQFKPRRFTHVSELKQKRKSNNVIQ